MDEPILGYGVIYGPDHKMRSSFSVAEMWAAIDDWQDCAYEWAEHRRMYGDEWFETVAVKQAYDRARQRVRDLLGMEAE